MNIPEAIVSRVSFNKFQELFIQFKVKKEDITPELEKHFRDLWENGTSLAIATAPFQVENEQSGVNKTEYSVGNSIEPREKTVYERLRWEVVGNAAEKEREGLWGQFKHVKALEKGVIKDNESRHVSSSEIWTPEEAEKLIAEFQGIPALENL